MPAAQNAPELARRGGGLSGAVVPAPVVRALAVLLLCGGLALPWLATWQGVLDPGAGRSSPVVRLRPELVELQGGTFEMGSSSPEGTDETVHGVSVERFAMCRTEVSVGQWEAVMGTRPNDCRWGCDDDHPVTEVAWADALQYLNRLTELENAGAVELPRTPCYVESAGKWTWDRNCTGYRLPTEAEWEYAARAGSSAEYGVAADRDGLCAHANVPDRSARDRHPDWVTVDCDDGVEYLAHVGSHLPNAWGLHDMQGNVWEWVWDRFAPYPTRTDGAPAVDQGGPASGDMRILRGGSYWDIPRWLRPASRLRVYPETRPHVGFGAPPPLPLDTLGLRCARNI